MTTFEYLAVLFSVVVGLAVTQTLRGLLRIVQHRGTMRIYWPLLIWTAAILQWAVFFWWFSAFGLAQLEEWHLPILLFVLAYSSALYFLLGLLHPDDAGANFDMRAHFEENQVWFFGVFLGLGVLDVVDLWFKQVTGVSTLSGQSLVEYSIFLGIWILGAAVLLRRRDGRLLGVSGLLYFVFALYITIRWGGVLGPTLGGG